MKETDEQLMKRVIKEAKEKGITLKPVDFTYTDEGLTIQSMAPDEWLDAMTMD